MRKLIALALALTLLFTFAAPAFAADTPPAVSLEQAINIAKAAFTVPTVCEKFFSDFEDYGGRQQWRLTWRNADGNRSVYMSVDAATGAVTSYYGADYSVTVPSSRLPKLTTAQAKAIADALIKRLQPAESAQARYVEPLYQPSYLPERGSMTYSFTYERMANGIPFAEHSFQVQVDGNSGAVTSYGFNWKTVEFPALTGMIDLEAAGKIFGEKIGVKAIWWRPSPENGVGGPLRLVYTVDRGNRMIDALTGELLDPQYYAYGRGGMDAQKSMTTANGGLTPAEQMAVDELAKYITADAADALIRAKLSLAGDYVRNGAYLSSDWEFPENAKIWSLNYTANEGTTSAKWASAQVDAATGVLIGFNVTPVSQPTGDVPPTYTRAQAQLIAEQYLAQLDAAKATQVKLVAPEYPVDDKTASQHSFTFVRVKDGFEFPANAITVTVDAYDGRVVGMNLRWADLPFPAVSGQLTPAEMTGKLLAANPLTLAYRTVTIDDQQVIRPVYALVDYAFAYDSTTGQALDYRGEPVVKLSRPIFSDVQGSKYEAEIGILIDLGIIDGTGKTFRPNDRITTAEFLKILTCVSNAPRPIPMTGTAWYKAYIDAATLQDIVLAGETVNPDLIVTRAAAARFLIRSLDLDYVAKLGIYQLPSGDSRITADRGALALAWGFGILKAESNSLKPLNQVTRGEAAALIVRLLRIER